MLSGIFNVSNHWTLTVVNPIEERVHFLDPLRGRLCGDEWINTVNRYVQLLVYILIFLVVWWFM